MVKYSEIRRKFNIEVMNGNAEDIAYFTHFLQNQTAEASQMYLSRVQSYNETLTDKIFSESFDFQNVLPIKWDVPFPEPEIKEFTFIDLFAGIGGFRIALQELGGKCMFSSEFNYHAQRAYELNFGEVPFGDITKINLDIVPKHDVLCAGFPCQPFSISGKMKGFEDTRGTLIYHVFETIERIRPKVVLLENVKHLKYHDKQRTLNTIVKHLEELGYVVSWKVLNASSFGVPQNRERLIIVGHEQKSFDFSEVKHLPGKILKDVLETDGEFEYLNEPYTILNDQRVQLSGLLFAGYRNKTIRKAGVRDGTEHLSRVHKQPNRIYSSLGVHPALPSQESSGRFWILDIGDVRKLTIKECYRIMGFPDRYKFIYNKSELYRQIGNSVCVPMIKAIGNQIKTQLLSL
ncbi:MAG: DNA cytosine methyltransferase [Bacteroidota bacterium]